MFVERWLRCEDSASYCFLVFLPIHEQFLANNILQSTTEHLSRLKHRSWMRRKICNKNQLISTKQNKNLAATIKFYYLVGKWFKVQNGFWLRLNQRWRLFWFIVECLELEFATLVTCIAYCLVILVYKKPKTATQRTSWLLTLSHF